MKAYYKTGSFKDSDGLDHKFVVCAVEDVPQGELMLAGNEDGGPVIAPVKETDGDGHVAKSVFMGAAVCNPLDGFNEELGKKIAYNRAMNRRLAQKWVASNQTGLIGPRVIQALLDQEVDYIASNPSLVVKGWTESEERKKRKAALKAEYAKLTDNQKAVVKALVDGADVNGLRRFARAVDEVTPTLFDVLED